MTKKVLLLSSSPRKKGNSVLLAARAAEALKESGVSVETIRLHGMNIAPCLHCDGCLRKKVFCLQQDDMQALYPKLIAAYGLIMASPIYWFSYNAQLKVFIDRWYGIAQLQADFLKGKPLGVILTYGDTDVYTSGAINAIRIFEDTARWVKAGAVMYVYGSADKAGDVLQNPELMEKAWQMGMKMGEELKGV